jgi:aconitate hydratase
VDFDPKTEPLGVGSDEKPVFLRDVWPTQAEVREAIRTAVRPAQFKTIYADVFRGDDSWRALEVPAGATYAWDTESTYVKEPPYFEGMTREPRAFRDVKGARALAWLGDSVTTDHISPAGSIKPKGPAGQYLVSRGVEVADFNQYGARRGNHEVMVRGTFANVRLRNRLVPGVEGGETLHFPDAAPMSIYDASVRYASEGVPLIVLAGKEYGSGSSRDWAAKGPYLQGIRAVIAESFERIHRSNLVGMGVVPMEFLAGETAESIGLSGTETYEIIGLAAGLAQGFRSGREVTVRAVANDGKTREFKARVRIDTPQEVLYVQHGGILQYVLRRLLTEP